MVAVMRSLSGLGETQAEVHLASVKTGTLMPSAGDKRKHKIAFKAIQSTEECIAYDYLDKIIHNRNGGTDRTNFL